MDFSLSEEENQLQAAARRFARQHVAGVAAKMDREDVFPADIFRKLGEDGFLGITLPNEYGGLALGYLAQATVLEELARVSPALALSVGAHSNLVADNLARNGTPELKERYLPALAKGTEIGALALTEPGSGSDAVSLRTTAVRNGEDYVMTGSKQFITNGPVADSYVVYAKTAPERGAHGITTFLVRREMGGFSSSKGLDKMGMRGSPTGSLTFEGVRVPASHRIGGENDGVGVMMSGLNIERAVLAAIPVGIIAECLELSLEHAREREQFGQKIGNFQLIQEKLANMYAALEASRMLLYRALAEVQEDPRKARGAATALTYASEASTRVALEAIQVYGGYGYMRDYPLERLARDAKLLEIGAGTSEIRRLLVARDLLGPGFGG